MCREHGGRHGVVAETVETVEAVKTVEAAGKDGLTGDSWQEGCGHEVCLGRWSG